MKKIKVSKKTLRNALALTDIGGYSSLYAPWLSDEDKKAASLKDMEDTLNEDVERLFNVLKDAQNA